MADADQGATRMRVTSESDVTRTVMEAGRYAREAGLSDVDAQALSTAVSELARNIIKYADSGEVLFKTITAGSSRGVVVSAKDRGPGIADIDAAMCDHFSSSGTLGLGLPGVQRMMDDFTIDSVPGESTTVCCLKWDTPPLRGNRPLEGYRPGDCAPPAAQCEDCMDIDAASHSRPCRGEYVNGDMAMIERREHLLMLAVIDGLGHGPEANKVSTAAKDYLRDRWSHDVVATMQGLHNELRGSLGAVAGIAVIDTRTGHSRFAGSGNITYRVFGPRPMRLLSMAGNLGHQIRSPKEQQHTLTDEDVVLIYSDGIKDRFELEDYPQMRYQSADTISQTVVDRFGKPHDDATCLAARIRL